MILIAGKKLHIESLSKEYAKGKQAKTNIDCDQAILLKEIRDKEPWKDRRNYATTAYYNICAKMSWAQFMEGEIGESLEVAEKMIKVLEEFGPAKLREFGHKLLYMLMKRTDDKELRSKMLQMAPRRARTHRIPSITTWTRMLNQYIPIPLYCEEGETDPNTILRERVNRLEQEVSSLHFQNDALQFKFDLAMRVMARHAVCLQEFKVELQKEERPS